MSSRHFAHLDELALGRRVPKLKYTQEEESGSFGWSRGERHHGEASSIASVPVCPFFTRRPRFFPHSQESQIPSGSKEVSRRRWLRLRSVRGVESLHAARGRELRRERRRPLRPPAAARSLESSFTPRRFPRPETSEAARGGGPSPRCRPLQVHSGRRSQRGAGNIRGQTRPRAAGHRGFFA